MYIYIYYISLPIYCNLANARQLRDYSLQFNLYITNNILLYAAYINIQLYDIVNYA